MSSEGEFVNRDYVFVVNPTGGNGRTGRDWKKLLPLLHSRLGKSWNVREALTTGPLHAIELAREAVQNGAAAVVAVGGDGTLNEVLNGFFKDGEAVHPQEIQAGPRTAIGLIPMGTGSDFARHFGWNVNDMNQAVDRLVVGNKRKMDVGRVVLVDDKVDRYFLNVASLHLSAKAGARVAKYKRLGNLSYVLGAIDAFRDHQNRNLKVRVDGGEWQAVPDVSAICIGNAKYFGGGMKITPTADPFNGKLEVVTLRDFKWYDFITKMHTLYAGSHIQLKNVSKESVSTIEVDEEMEAGRREVYVQADGEHIGFLRASFSVLPGKIDFIV
ncbi:unnamed protein product [Sphagnum troendelagicum]|uniref:DAGKc domain-containing protein n=1 Tax=Sphagnum troendelagicum TaxID=128251 RepID=A0ABP0U711_9BRYO